MSDPQTRATDPIDEFAAAVEAEFGTPWRTERLADGFVARYPLGHAVADGFTAGDEVHMRVAADPLAKTFAFATRRIAASDLDRERAGWTTAGYGYSRTVETTRYTGMRRTMSFRRTPDGLVPNPDAPDDTAGREADLRAVAERLGWTEKGGPPTGLNVAVKLPPKRMLALMAIFAGVVVLSIVGIAVFVIAQVAGAFIGADVPR